jgi:hypothetical protein
VNKSETPPENFAEAIKMAFGGDFLRGTLERSRFHGFRRRKFPFFRDLADCSTPDGLGIAGRPNAETCPLFSAFSLRFPFAFSDKALS